MGGERHPRRRHLHRARQEEDCHCHGRCLCSEEAGQNFVRLRRLILICKRCVLCPSLVETLCGRLAVCVCGCVWCLCAVCVGCVWCVCGVCVVCVWCVCGVSVCVCV